MPVIFAPEAGFDLRVRQVHPAGNPIITDERLFERVRGDFYINVLFLAASDRVKVSQSRRNRETR